MKIRANDIKLGTVLVYESDLWVVIKNPDHTQPGKGGAYVQVEMKNLKNGVKSNHRFHSTKTVEKAQLEQRNMEYSYTEGDEIVFMDSESFEQIHVNNEILGDKLQFFAEDVISVNKGAMSVIIEFHNSTIVNVKLPNTIIFQIDETDPVIKGASITSSYKPAYNNSGMKIMVPQYLKIGDKVIIKTSDMSFVEKVK